MNSNQNFVNPNQYVPVYPRPNYEMPTRANETIVKAEGEDSFVNAILRKSVGKTATFYFSYPDSEKWRDMIYEGVVEIIGEDYLVIKEEVTNYRHVLLMLYLEWVVFKNQ